MAGPRGCHWGFGGNYALVFFRGPYLEVDLDDMRSGNRILGVIGFGGTLQLHLPRKISITLLGRFGNSDFPVTNEE